MNEYSVFGHLPIVCMVVFEDNSYAITANNKYEHAEYILLQVYLRSKIIAIFTNLEPCLSCSFYIYQSNIKYVFFGNYNTSNMGGSHLLKNSTVYGGLYTNINLEIFFRRYIRIN